jgi:hypothetical protein
MSEKTLQLVKTFRLPFFYLVALGILFLNIETGTTITAQQEQTGFQSELAQGQTVSTVKPQPPVDDSQNQDIDKCQIKMAQETAEYIKAQKIQLKNQSYKFYANKDEQAYVVSSNEPVKVLVKAPVKNIVAVINSADKTGKSVFYIMEQEIKPETVTYSVKRDSAVLQSIDIKISNFAERTFGPQLPPDPNAPPHPKCLQLLNEWNSMATAALAAANTTCQRQQFCAQRCTQMDDPIHVPYIRAYVDPTSWRCRFISAEAISWKIQVFINRALDDVVSTQVSLYTPVKTV